MKKEINISSRIESLSIVENLIDEISIDLNLVADIYGNVLIAVIEAVTNAIVHGNKNEASKLVRVAFFDDSNYLTVRVEDQGPGFDYDDIPDPTKPDNVEKPDGRGVFLMRHLADEIVFDRGGSIVQLKFKI
ncbi:MAG: ATP-binding protein [Salinivirgaceae bacterium]